MLAQPNEIHSVISYALRENSHWLPRFQVMTNHIVDVESMDVFPVGWCESNNYPLKPPRKLKLNKTRAPASTTTLNKRAADQPEYVLASPVFIGGITVTTREDAPFCPKIEHQKWRGGVQGMKLLLFQYNLIPENQGKIEAASRTWVQRRFAERCVNVNVRWCVVIGQGYSSEISYFVTNLQSRCVVGACSMFVSRCPRETSSSTYSEMQGEDSWCPKIYFNHRCFSGPYLSKGRIAELPKCVGPGPVVLVMKEVRSISSV